MFASVIMINRNGGERLRSSLQSCLAAMESAWSSRQAFELIVVDNGSTDDSATIIGEAIRGQPFPCRLVEEPIAGVNSARNAGLRTARGEFLIFTDSDLEFSRGWLTAFLEAFDSHPDMRVFGGRVLVGEVVGRTPDWLPLSGPLCRTEIVVQMDNGETSGVYSLGTENAAGPVGPNMGFHRSVFEEFGPFDERFGLRPGSLVPGAEAEYFDRLQRAGVSFLYVANAVVYHPLLRRQLSKKYFLRRLHGVGRVFGRLQRIHGVSGRQCCGIRLYVLNNLVRAIGRYLSVCLTGSVQERFYLRGGIAIHMGHLHEEWTSWWTRSRRSPSAEDDEGRKPPILERA